MRLDTKRCEKNTVRALVALATLGLLFSAGCSDSGGPTEPDDNNNDTPKTVVVTVQDFSFSPSPVEVFEGDTVRWMRVGGSHTTTSGTGAGDPNAGDLWNSPLNAANPSFERVFDQAGSFPYFCVPHDPNMRSSVNVSAR